MSPMKEDDSPIVNLSAGSTHPLGADTAQAMRSQAEELAGKRAGSMPENKDELSPEAARRALHELRVHQIELEMQNEELRRTQHELEISRARYFDLYDLAPVGYVTLSELGLILEANLVAAKLLGVARGALIMQPLPRFIIPADQEVYYRHRKALWETGAPQSWDMQLLRAGAAPFWARLDAIAAQNVDGAFAWRAVITDITERKLAEEKQTQLETQTRRLQKAEGLTRMASAIAHRFNNHLTAVMGNLELAISDLPWGPGIAERLTDALHAARDAAAVSSLMLTYLGQKQTQRVPLDLSGVCHRCLPWLQAAMPTDMALETDLPSPGPVIVADASQLQQVLTNLVTNAWEACGDGRSTIRVTVSTVPPADIPASHRVPADWWPRDNAYACLEVADTGCGVEVADIEKLFDPFFTTKFTGRGLGLPVVLGIVRRHEGAVTVNSAPGRGSTFRVYLPVSDNEVRSEPERKSNSLEFDRGGTVLLVEDEPTVRRMGGDALMSLGFEVLPAKDGVEAIEIFRQHQAEVRCVLCDLTMPRMDGWETLTALRKLAPGLPVILASGYAKAEVMAGEHLELPQAFLSKPYHIQELREAIGGALHQAKKRNGS